MDRPRVIIHNLMSLDGRLDGFPADPGLYYELAAQLPHQAVLTGSGTMLAAAAHERIDLSGEDPGPAPSPRAPAGTDPRPLLVIVDSQGRLTRYDWLRAQPFWRDLLVLCSAATPVSQLERLRRQQVGHLVLGDDRVDLAAALRVLAERYQVRTVRVDAGGGLNGALLRAGLAAEVSVVLAPYLAAGADGSPLRLVSGPGTATALALTLTWIEHRQDGHLWLRYTIGGSAPGLAGG